MTDQTILAGTLVILMGLLIWGKWRYDAVTLICLAALVCSLELPVSIK